MLVVIVALVAAAELAKPPRQPVFDFNEMCKVVELDGANQLKVRQEYYRDMTRWTRLHGVDVPSVGAPGYSDARQDLELLLGRFPDCFVEDENPDHPITRNAYWLRYVWTKGELIQYHLVSDGWATVNDEGRKGRYGKYLIAAQEEAKRLHEGRWK